MAFKRRIMSQQAFMSVSSGISNNDNTSSIMGTSSNSYDESGCFTNCQLGFSQNNNNDNDRDKESHSALTEAEKTITQDLYHMNMKERENILHDVHGVFDELVETPELLQSSFQELDWALLRHHQIHCSSHLSKAFHQNYEYVRSLYLMFLRADKFCAKSAAERMELHFEVKAELFGEDKLCRDITLSDFTPADMQTFKVGYFQICPTRDRAGRALLCNVLSKQAYKEPINAWRHMWYLHMTALLDEETQRKGIVVIIYNVTPKWSEALDKELYAGIAKVKNATPVKTGCVHHCFSDPRYGILIKFVSTAIERETRTRTRLHCGSHVEVQYDLLGYGIPTKDLPINADGGLRRNTHLKWLAHRKIQEEMAQTHGTLQIIVPGSLDVLFGPGKVIQSHSGNVRLAHTIEERLDDYYGNNSVKGAKQQMVKSLVELMLQQGTRFLRQNRDGIWEVADHATAVDKVSHGFRNRKASRKTKKGDEESSSHSVKRTDSPMDIDSCRDASDPGKRARMTPPIDSRIFF